MSVPEDDWRRCGQDRTFPPGTEWRFKPYRMWSDAWQHDHCAMCWAKILDPAVSESHGSSTAADPAVLSEAYATTQRHRQGENYHWVCEACFDDFAAEFGWVRVAAD